jgi:hypothetical protein
MRAFKHLCQFHTKACITAQKKVAGSIPDGVTGIFHWHNLYSRTMALELTQPLTEMSTRNISWGLGQPMRRADNLTNLMCRLSWNLGASTSWNPLGLSRPVMELLYLYLSLVRLQSGGSLFQVGGWCKSLNIRPGLAVNKFPAITIHKSG